MFSGTPSNKEIAKFHGFGDTVIDYPSSRQCPEGTESKKTATLICLFSLDVGIRIKIKFIIE